MRSQVRFGGVVMTNYDIQWKKESYLKYARENEFDYSLVSSSRWSKWGQTSLRA